LFFILFSFPVEVFVFCMLSGGDLTLAEAAAEPSVAAENVS